MRHYWWLVFVPLTLIGLLAGGVAALAGAAPAQQPRAAGSGPVGSTPTPVCGASWTVVTSPSPGFLDNTLYGVSALTSNDVWAVGSAYDASGREGTLTEHWNGSAWTVIPSPNMGTVTSTNRLYSVTAVAANDAWAVGYYTPPPPNNYQHTLILHWDGSAWTGSSSPNMGTSNNVLYGVTKIAANDVWAVGAYLNGAVYQTLTEHWTGASWSIVASPNGTTSGNNYLYSVSGVAANDIWAVGSYANTGGLPPLTLHWTGSAWSVVATPYPPANDRFNGVAAIAPNDAWAVGSAIYTDLTRILIQHWNGVWSNPNLPNLAPRGSILQGVAASGPSDVWAVGYLTGTQVSTLIVHWDGGAWSQVSSPSPSNNNDRLLSVSALSSTDAWAVGLTSSGLAQTLIEHYASACGANTPTPGPSLTPPPPPPTQTPPLTRTSTPTESPTITPGGPSLTPTPTMTTCPIQFTDVPSTNPFYVFIRCLACRQIVSGYSDGTYRWGADVTRGQLSKIIANAAGFAEAIPSTQQTFQDVPAGNAFWLFIERLVAHGAISGYTCGGGAGEPCVPPQNRPYFRWGANATRGQIAKITALAADIQDPIPTTQQTFQDVPGSNPFWLWIEQLAGRGVISGYTCGGAGEPCVPPQNRPYFRWTANATRGQMAKIGAQTFYPACQTPARR